MKKIILDSVLNRFRSSARFVLAAGVCAFLLATCAWAQPGTQSGTAASAASAVGSSATAPNSLALIPMPREVHQRALLLLNHGVGVSTSSHAAEDMFAVKDLVDTLKDRGIDAREGQRGQVKIILLRQDTSKAKDILAREHVDFTPAMQDEGYVLLTDGNKCYDIAATSAGLYYGAQTIKQLVARGRPGLDSKPYLQGVLIRDWPAMKYRGVDDDLSRGPVPTLAFQEHQVKVFSEYKVNLYSPYFENTLAYASNPLPAPPGGAMTRSDAEQLVRYAQQYHVTIVPEQEAFGHLHHVLTFDKYSKLAETPHGSVLAPVQPGSIQLIQQWFKEIAAMFPGPFMHIGADETFDLGKGQTKSEVEKEGLGKVYMDFLIQIHQALEPLHKQLLFWGDIAMNDPEQVKTLPKDMIAIAWVYSPEPEGYDKWLLPFTNAGLQTWVAPGISNWSRVYPDNNSGLLNIQEFVRDGQRLGSTGVLNTVWNDDGEGLFNQDWYGILFGAAAGWQPGTSSIPQFQDSYGQVFHGDPTGKINQAQIDLMAAQKILDDAGIDDSTDHLFWMDPWSKEGQQVSAKLLPVVQTLREQAEQAIILMEQARAAGPLREEDALDAMEMGARRMDFLGYKFEAAQEMLEAYDSAYREQNDPANNKHLGAGLYDISSNNGRCQDLRDGYGLTRDLYREAWLKENRPYWLDNVSAQYELAMQLWIQRGVRFSEAQDQWYETHTLPPPEAVGLPPLPAAAATQ
ncbi:MAG: glycoside hydrolase family 20 zincin-like fold domain-containing protein [Acidobacteriaceae bacterium]